MKGTIIKIIENKITFVQEGAKESQTFELAEWVKPSYVKLGDAEIRVEDSKISFVTMDPGKQIETSKQAKDPLQPNKKSKWEDEMVTFEDLLTKAHEMKQSFSIHTDVLKVDLEKKYALFKARIDVVGKDKNVAIFEGHGDATNDNVKGDHIKPHFIRMAETRAIVRALRWYTNNGCAEEEK